MVGKTIGLANHGELWVVRYSSRASYRATEASYRATEDQTRHQVRVNLTAINLSSAAMRIVSTKVAGKASRSPLKKLYTEETISRVLLFLAAPNERSSAG